MLQLMPDTNVSPQDQYRGPISLLKEAYQERGRSSHTDYHPENEGR